MPYRQKLTEPGLGGFVSLSLGVSEIIYSAGSQSSQVAAYGTGFPGALRALPEKRFAAAASRFAVSRKSIV
jgi:hypothetical protein